ncbi:hypothetical protein [Algibacter sp. L1A34]|uniref:hypothetical protein n=1 Tax=Algibacter sp. L1A34 TaxID=2686365 RepID=UPI00131DFDD2|nr:hypothetical protein [Algibacter sp. L1A34]
MNENVQKLQKDKLKAMYFQTEEWIEDVEFYEEELEFFNSLISNRINTTTIEDLNHKEIYRNKDNLLWKLSDDVLSEIKVHRTELARLIDTKNITENIEENKTHLHLLEKTDKIKNGIKQLKKALFKYVKDHPFKFQFDTVIEEL